jgi:hypothetical protein
VGPFGDPRLSIRYLPSSVQSRYRYLYDNLVLPLPPSSRRSQVVPLVGLEPTRLTARLLRPLTIPFVYKGEKFPQPEGKEEGWGKYLLVLKPRKVFRAATEVYVGNDALGLEGHAVVVCTGRDRLSLLHEV